VPAILLSMRKATASRGWTLWEVSFVAIAMLSACGAGSETRAQPSPRPAPAQPAERPPVSVRAPESPSARPRTRLEVVGRFRTNYPCCEPRVINIKRAVQILDGRRIRPGATFSLNDALGERTAARGFVAAPMIVGGSFVDSVGGGISQVATTLYNAAFFAGLDLVSHTPHSIYISRYPMGREATISWGGPELIFRNDWNAPIRIEGRATNTFVRFRLFSLPLGRRVVTNTGPPQSYIAPRTIYIQSRDIPPGTQRVLQSAGSPGFDVTYTRRVYAWSTLLRSETFHARYQPQNAIIAVGASS
jgi:vancomycin resistance protein YoaR